MTIHVGLDVGRAGKDSTGLTAIEQMDGKQRVIASVTVPVTGSRTQQAEAFVSATLRLLLMIYRHAGATDETLEGVGHDDRPDRRSE